MILSKGLQSRGPDQDYQPSPEYTLGIGRDGALMLYRKLSNNMKLKNELDGNEAGH